VASLILSHQDLATANVIVEADVPDVQSVVTKALQGARQCIVVALGAGQAAGDDPNGPSLVMDERIIVTVGQVPGLAQPPLSPVQVMDRLIPLLHFSTWTADGTGGVYLVASRSPLDGEAGVTGHQLALKFLNPVCPE
jgi:hypothetical protein